MRQPFYAVLLFSVVSCADCYSLDLVVPSSPLAVGASTTIRYQWGRWYDCKPDPSLPLCAPAIGGGSRITALTEVKIDDPSIFSAEITGADGVRITALQAGATMVTVTGVDQRGASSSKGKKLTALAPEVAELSHGCLTRAPPQVYAFPTSTEVSFSMTIKGGATPLITEGLVVPIDPGALAPVPDAGQTTFQTPGAPVRTALKTSLGRPFELPVQVYEPAQLDAFVLRPATPDPQALGGIVLVELRLQALGLDVCMEPMTPPAKHVVVATPQLCTLAEGNDSSSRSIGPTVDFTVTPLFFVKNLQPGLCQVDVSVDGLGSKRLELTFGK